MKEKLKRNQPQEKWQDRKYFMKVTSFGKSQELCSLSMWPFK